MPKIYDLFMDDIELILEQLPQGSSITIHKEELETDDNLFYIETEDTSLTDMIEIILHQVEQENEDDEFYDEDLNEDDAFHNISIDDEYDQDWDSTIN